MLITLIFLGEFILIKLVTANPLMQSIQSCPGSNYQGVYQPYENFVLQPSNFNPYPQQLMVQNPVYNQPISLTDHISDIIWEKLLSSPTFQNILESNDIYDQNFNTQIDPLNPYNLGFTNNYAILPSEYVKVNETENKSNANLLRNDYSIPNGANLAKEFNEIKDGVAINRRKKKVLDNNDRKDTVDNSKPRKAKQTPDTRSFNIEHIKCYTPAEVLEEGSKKPVKKSKEVKRGKKKKETGINKGQSDKDYETKNKSKKSTKSKRNKSKKSKENCKETNENVPTKTRKKYKKEKCMNKCKSEEIVLKNCDKDMDDVFNLKQDCTDLENRCTRNSKDDAVRDSRNIYPDIPDDLSKNYALYINDLFSNTQVPNSNMFYGSNMYPFDLNQIYQIPQYSNIDISKQGNRIKTKSSRRKKKQKKKNPSKKKKEESKNDQKDTKKNDNNNVEDSSIKHKNNNDEMSNTNSNNNNVENVIKKPDIHVQSEPQNIEDTTKATTITEITPSVQTTPTTITSPVTIDTSTTTVKNASSEHYSNQDDSELFEEPDHQVEEIQILNTGNRKENLITIEFPETIKITEIYEEQIPETVNTILEEEIDELLNEERNKDEEPLSSIDPYDFNKVTNIGFLDGIPSIFHNGIIDDYYPDFTADNHAYLVSGEEMDLRNIHDRYFYTTHKNIDSEETLNVPDLTRSKGYNSNNDKVIERNDISNNKNDDIIFKTPPGLDVPGFITRKINTDKQDSTEIFYQHTNNDFNFDNFADKSDHSYRAERYENIDKERKEDKTGRVVETVYARSKVVKYGQGQNFEKTLKENNTLDEVQKDGGKTIIIAKSISPEDLWKYH